MIAKFDGPNAVRVRSDDWLSEFSVDEFMYDRKVEGWGNELVRSFEFET